MSTKWKEDCMGKIKIDKNAFVYPMPVVLVGTVVEGRANFITVAWVSRLNYNPPLIGAALGKIHHTNKGIHQHKTFSVNIPGMDLIEKTDYCGLVSGKNTDKSEIFKTFTGDLPHTPMIEECPLCMECKLFSVVNLPSNDLFIGEIIGAYVDERFLSDGKPDVQKINPFTLTMPDNNYWKVGPHAGKAWGIGKDLKDKSS
jgi:flavin reductase (DIM6/NTAB) family NADH-FMN oxidoreductase RutF